MGAKGRKYKVGDRVYMNSRTPQHVMEGTRQRQRVIVEVRSDRPKRCCWYRLGSNDRGDAPIYWFRSYMLRTEKLGRRQWSKRKYHFKRKYVRKQPLQPSPYAQVMDRVDRLAEAYSTTQQGANE